MSFFELLEKEAASGNTMTMNRVAMYLIEGLHGVEKNYETAVDWIKQAAAMQDVTAFLNLSCIYRYGLLGYEQDKLKSEYWSSRAFAVQNPSFIKAANLIEEGNATQAIPHLREALKKYHCAASVHYLGIFYKKGQHVPLDVVMGTELLTLATNMGSLTAMVDSKGPSKLKISKKDACGGCGKWAVNICGACKSQKYCSFDCQNKAWPKHKANCFISVFEAFLAEKKMD